MIYHRLEIGIDMLRFVTIVGTLSLMATFAFAQQAPSTTLQFDAVIGPDGEVVLVRKGEAEAAPSSGFKDWEATEGLKDNPDLSTVNVDQGMTDLFLVKNAAGTVKGVFFDQATLAANKLDTGDTVEVMSYKATGAGASALLVGDINDSYLEGVAKAASKKLLQTARELACEFDPAPETITPTVSVSFGLLGQSAGFQISGTWRTSELRC